MQNLLDFNQPDEQTGKDFSEIVRWWERKRLLYNIIILVCGLLSIFLAHHFKTKFIVPAIIYGIAANLFFCAGIMVEAWDQYYFKGRLNMSNYRIPLFVIGTLFSALVTVVFDRDLLL